MMVMSELERLYRLIFRVPPSVETVDTLRVIEHVFGMAQDDPLSQMLVLLMRVTDQMQDVLEHRTEAERVIQKRMVEAVDDLRRVALRLDELENTFSRRRVRIPALASVSLALPTYRRTSPLLSYFGNAFRLRAGTEGDERIAAARWDLTFTIGFIALVMMATWVGRTVLKW
jgi:hypothetical protein